MYYNFKRALNVCHKTTEKCICTFIVVYDPNERKFFCDVT